MNIVYLANIRLPTEKAHGYQIMRTCAELIRQGADVELIVPRRRNPTLGGLDPFGYYGIPSVPLRITALPCVDLIGTALHRLIGPAAFWLQTATFARHVRRYLKSTRADTVYSRDELLLKLIGPLGNTLAVELHALPKPKYRSVLRRARKIFVITQAIADELVGQGFAEDDMILSPDAVDLAMFDGVPEDKVACRRLTGLPLGRPIALYVGNLFEWKGVYTFADASKDDRFLHSSWYFVTVGGVGDALARLRRYVEGNRMFRVLPYQQHQSIARYLKAADVLVLPNSATTDRSRRYTSPLKLFEYLAARRPIVASDLPSIREIVSEREVIFVKPDDPQDLARGIREARETDQSARVTAARQLAERYTWEARARIIFGALSALPKQEFSGRLTP